MLDPAFEALLRSDEAPLLGRHPPERERREYRDACRRLDGSPPGDVAVRDLSVAGGAGNLPARLYTPAGAEAPGGLLVYLHGGGFVIGDLDTHDGLCRRLARASGARILSVGYRLAPEHPFPAAHDDALAAVRWTVEHAAELGADPSRIGLGGDSAGGNLAASTALQRRDRNEEPKLACLLLLYPALGGGPTASMQSLCEGYLLDTTALAYFNEHLGFSGHPELMRLAPLAHPSLADLPPTTIVTAGFDPLKDDGELFAGRLREAGVPVELTEESALIHGFFTMAGVSPAVGTAIEAAGSSLGRALAR